MSYPPLILGGSTTTQGNSMNEFEEYEHRWLQYAVEEPSQKERQLSLFVEEQRQRGKIGLMPMPDVDSCPFRSSLAVEALPVFVSQSYSEPCWVYERQLRDQQTGKPLKQLIRVGGEKVLTTAHQRCWYQLLHLWGDAGYPLIVDGQQTWGKLQMSAYQLVKHLRGDDSSHHYKRVRVLLRELSSIPIRREDIYEDSVDEAEFTLLNGVEWNGRSLDRRTRRPRTGGSSEVLILFSSQITENFLHRKVKALMLQPYLNLTQTKGRSSEIAALLYPRLDYQLAAKDSYHRKLAPLFEELGLRPCTYKSKRKERLEAAVAALNDLPILGEQFSLQVNLELAKDRTDWMLAATKSLRGKPAFPLLEKMEQ